VRRIAAVSILAVALLLVPAAPSYAWGGHGGHGGRDFHGHGVIVAGPSRAPSIMFMSPATVFRLGPGSRLGGPE